jgi:glycosyltransferase involved in cell wall biosynthesis
VTLAAGDPVVTYCARNLEPYRGFNVFMRALPKILKGAPGARVLVVGGDGVSYGRLPIGAPNWREAMLAEIGDTIDRSRVHFLGTTSYKDYLTILQISAVHVYLTYPFVLSWSLVEALAAGCTIVASGTPPVRETIEDGRNGWLFDFFDTHGLADRVVEALRSRGALARLREQARRTALKCYDLRGVCLPRQIAIWERLMGRRPRQRSSLK